MIFSPMKSFSKESTLGVPKELGTPILKTSARRIKNNTTLLNLNSRLSFQRMGPFLSNMSTSKRSGMSNELYAPGRIGDLKSIKSIKNTEQQEMPMRLESGRSCNGDKFPRIGNFGINTDQTLEKTLGPPNQFAPSQGSPSRRNEFPPQRANE
jgi:hypothetical protein